MLGVNSKYFRKTILATGMILVFSGVSIAQVPPQPPAPPPPPPPAVVDNPAPPAETSDNENDRRRSALVSCCLRRGEGLGAYCSVEQLEAAVRVGDLVRKNNPDGSLYCAEGTGTVASRTLAGNEGNTGQALTSPLEPVQDAENTPDNPANLINSLFEFLFGFTTPTQ